MNELPEPVYAKTSRGRAALAARAVTGRLRMALILANGLDGLAVLERQLGADAKALLDELAKAGLIRAVRPPQPASPVVPTRPSRNSSPAAVTPMPPAAALTPLAAFQREAVVRLAPHFGPDVLLVARPLLDAREPAEIATALAAIERRLAAYVGKAHAARILAGLGP